MSGRMRSIAPSRSGLDLTLVLLLMVLLFGITGCESLATDTSASTGTSTRLLSPQGPTLQSLLRQLAGHLHHPGGARPKRRGRGSAGPLNTPLEMNLELHAWSEASGDCGTLTVAGYPNGRVLELSVEAKWAACLSSTRRRAWRTPAAS